jgi:hypothetical protein
MERRGGGLLHGTIPEFAKRVQEKIGLLTFLPRYEFGTIHLQSMSTKHYTTMFGYIHKIWKK